MRRLRLLGTPAEERFDKITRRAVRALGIAASALEIVGEQLVWRKSVQGFERLDVLRPSSFAERVVGADEVCVSAEGAHGDSSSPGSGSSFAFRVGIAVHFEGERVGALSIADPNPRPMTVEDIARLQELASLVEGELSIVALSETQIQLAVSTEERVMPRRVDRLTGLWNRDAIVEIAGRELARVESSGTMAGLVLLEIEGERFDAAPGDPGPVARESTIRAVASRLRAFTRPTDALGRHGPASFALVLQNATVEGTARAAERLRVALANDAAVAASGATGARVACSTGFAVATDGAEAARALLQSTEDALQRAKAAPRDRPNGDGIGKLTRVG